MSYAKLNIGLDRCRFVLSSIAIDGRIYCMRIEKGEKAEIFDIATGKVISISDFYLLIDGISLGSDDNYRIEIKLEKKTNAFVLEVNVPKLLYNTNERNVNDLQHLSQVNQMIEKLLAERGVYTDMAKARLLSVEMNVNSTDKKLYDAMKIIRKGFNTGDEKVFVVEYKNNIESLMIKNTYRKIKVYNKSQQLQDTSQLCEHGNLVRIEITAIDKGAINTITNYNPTLHGIIENWDKLEDWFKDKLVDYIKKPCDEYNKAVENAMVEKLKRGVKTYDVLTTEGTKGNLVDIEIFARAMKRYYKETGRKSPNTSIQNTKSRYEKADKELYDSLVGNIDALDKLWEKIGI